jgi:structural maintenance of chromosome 1
MGYLKYIELENFKSYEGSIRIGPFKSFTAIIGPNGSGKSNLMDAISFVLGESTKNLRVKKLNDLIHGAPIGKPVAHRASVSFVYSYESLKSNDGSDGGDESPNDEEEANNIGKEIKFTRTVVGASSEYRIDGKAVSAVDYQNELEKIGIYLKAKNFLVYQGQVESIAIKNAKEITQVFEEISRSIELKDEYERLKQEMDKAELDTQANFQKKRGVAAQKKEAKMEKEEAEKYHKLKQELNEQELQLRLYQLYYNEKASEDIRDELEKRQDEIIHLESKRERIEEEIKEKKKQQGHETREIAKIEENIKELELKLAKKKPQFIKVKESSFHLLKKLETSKTCLEAAQKAHEQHLNELKSIEQELSKLNKERESFEREIQKNALSQGISMELRESQMRNYQHLKEEAAKRNVKYQEQLDALQREQKLDQDSLDNEMRKRGDAGAKTKQKEFELDEQKVKLSKLSEYISNTEQQVEQQKELETRMSAEIDKANHLCKDYENELAKVMSDIGDARIDKFESSRSQKKAEVIDQLKKKFTGVYGRLIDHCEPVHRKYQLAITKVMGKSIDAIVVDTEKTARECIQFMKEQHLQAETFYPLDYIEANILDERLREIREPKNTKLLFDVIKYQPALIKKALIFAVGNCLVCESDDDARNLAFGSTERHKVVSLDGTLFQKSGLISGGSTELKQKARRWDEKHLDALRKRKEELTEQLKEQHKIRRKEPELADLRANIKGLEYRLKYSKQSREMSEQKVIQSLEKELDQLKREGVNNEPKIAEIEKRLNERSQKIKKLKQEANQVEDEIFRSFCEEINVPNIRIYEERELAGQQERVKERMLFEEKKTRLNTQLEFEKSRDTQKSFEKWRKETKENENELQKLRAEEDSLAQAIKQLEEQIERRKSDIDRLRVNTDEIETEIGEIKKRLSTHNKDINDTRKKINSIEAKLLDKKLERHAVLKNAKIELIRLPMLTGSMEDIADDDQIPLTQQQQSATLSSIPNTESLNTISTNDQSMLFEREAKIKIDYKKLDDQYFNLESSDEIDKTEARILSRLNELRELLHHFQIPNYRVDEKLDTVNVMWESTAAEFDKARSLAKKVRNAFIKIKQERYERFMKCFDHINARIDDIYKSLCMNQGAQASLVLENAEDPYSEGIIYNCVAPGKRFRQMDNLSGGEKTVAALALLFAIRSYNPSPFFVLDEVDAALDNTNISKVANYINEQSKKGLQCIVISLKEEFFHHAHALIGVYPIANECISSNIISLDLTKISEE